MPLLSLIMNHLYDSCAKQWWVSCFKVFNSGRLCRKTAFNFSVVQIGAMKGSWKSVAEIFLLQVALGSATLSPHRSRCLRTGNFSPPIKSKNLFFFLTFKQQYTYMIRQLFLINMGNNFSWTFLNLLSFFISSFGMFLRLITCWDFVCGIP